MDDRDDTNPPRRQVGFTAIITPAGDVSYHFGHATRLPPITIGRQSPIKRRHLSTREAALYLGVTPEALRMALYRGQLVSAC